MNELPMYKIRGKYWLYDERLEEFRNVADPNDRMDVGAVRYPDDYETPDKTVEKVLADLAAEREHARTQRDGNVTFAVRGR